MPQVLPHPIRQRRISRKVFDRDPIVVSNGTQRREEITQVDDAFVERRPLCLPGGAAVRSPPGLPPCAVLGMNVRQVWPQCLQTKPVLLVPLPDHVSRIVDRTYPLGIQPLEKAS